MSIRTVIIGTGPKLIIRSCGEKSPLSKRRMGTKNICLLVLCLLFVIASMVDADTSPVTVKKIKGKKVCDQGWECKGWSEYCCNLTISQYFDYYQFENVFSKRNSPVAQAAGFWDFKSFIIASAIYQPLGFGTTGNKTTQMKEIAAFLAHIGSQTSCGYGVATGGPTAWGLCYNREMSPNQDYCDESYKYTYPCAPGADYYGRGALPIYWNYNYGYIGDCLHVDLLHHPEYIEQNATLAFQAAMFQWLTPLKKGQPSAHDAMVGNWKPTKNDTLSHRTPGFGLTMNILYGERVCGKGDIDDMNTIVTHYLYYLDLMGVGREEAGAHDVLTCAEQKVFNPAAPKKAASS
ncbi:unnamed protein product [Lactuca saligna]|uniref:Glycoside hydrolase family 19 catalytic domain-containing protein n=1 Tax=Lactuca saligna TaxID=75948 RepID=A0AA35ZD62_LACSI|nr:unnamed protein product [Lactuca saligna]